MNVEAKKACKSMGINLHDLHEVTLLELKNSLNGESEKIIEMRYIHKDSNRRKKLKILADYVRNNKQNLQKGEF